MHERKSLTKDQGGGLSLHSTVLKQHERLTNPIFHYFIYLFIYVLYFYF